MICDICKKDIKEPFYVEVNAIVVKWDDEYVKGITFNPTEKEELVTKLIAHKSCWQKLLEVKKGKKMEVK